LPRSHAPVDPSTLRFGRPETGVAFHRLREVAGAAGEDWLHLPLIHRGSGAHERWANPVVGAKDLARGLAFRKRPPGGAWRTVGCVAYGDRFPEVFGLAWEAGQIPAGDGWGVVLRMGLRARPLMGDHLDAHFVRRQDGVEVETFHVGTGMKLDVASETLRVDFGLRDQSREVPELLEEELVSWRQLKGFHDAVVRLVRELRGRLDQVFATGRVQLMEHGPYKGRGVPPDALFSSPSPEQAKELHTDAVAELSRRVAVLREHSEAMHGVLRSVLPPL